MSIAKCKDCSFSTPLESSVDEHIANTNHEMKYIDEDDT